METDYQIIRQAQRTILPSQVRLVTKKIPGCRTLAVGWFFDAGSRDETAGQIGAAHYLEHMLFKGTSTSRAEEISARFDEVGGELNAYTAKDHTCFYVKILPDNADMAITTVTEMLTESLLAAGDFEAERSVILDEIGMQADDPTNTAYALALAYRYGKHPLGREVTGSQVAVASLSRHEVINFWKANYHPANLVISAAGDISPETLIPLLEKSAQILADWGHGNQPLTSRRSAEINPSSAVELKPESSSVAARNPALTSAVTHTQLNAGFDAACQGKVLLEPRPTEQDSCVLMFSGLSRYDADRPVLMLLGAILGGGMSSRLFVEVREHRGWAYHIDCINSSYRDGGDFSVEWLCAPSAVADVVALVQKILFDVCQCGVSEAELRRAKGQLRGQLILSLESAVAQMEWLGRNEILGGCRSAAELIEQLMQISAAQVQALARQIFFHPPVLTIVGVEPDMAQILPLIENWQ